MRKLILMFGMILLVCFAFVFSVENRNGFILGDFIFSKTGLPAWSRGDTGFHNTIIVTFILLIIGAFGLDKARSELNVSKSKILVILIICALLYQPAFNFFYVTTKGNTYGLKSIDYIRNSSKLKIEDTNGISILQGNFVFHNYSNDERKFFVKLLRSDKQSHINPRCDYLVEAIDFEDNLIVVPPRTEISVGLKKETSTNSIYQMYKGEFTGIDLCIYNEDEQVNFIEYQY